MMAHSAMNVKAMVRWIKSVAIKHLSAAHVDVKVDGRVALDSRVPRSTLYRRPEWPQMTPFTSAHTNSLPVKVDRIGRL